MISAIIVIIIAALLLIWLLIWQRDVLFTPNADNVLPDVSKVVDTLPKKSVNHPTIMLADSNQPVPTNSWLSGLVFGGKQSVVYASPWTLQAAGNGVSVSYPTVNSTPTTVWAEHSNDIQINTGSDSYAVQHISDISAEVAFKKGTTVTITEGSPYLYLAIPAHTTTSLQFSGNTSTRASNERIVTIGDKRYGVWTDKHIAVKQADNQLQLTADDTARQATLIALPPSIDTQTAFALADNVVTDTKVSYSTSGDSSKTTYTLTTNNHQPTLFGMLPNQYQGGSVPNANGSMLSLLGEQKFSEGTTFSYSLQRSIPDDTIITKSLTGDQKAQLVQSLKSDIAATTFDATDSYGAGKQLYRAANLLELTHELDEDDQASIIEGKLATQLDMWLDPSSSKKRSDKYFYYDPQIHGIVGVQPGFGSETFNDHHFHYGYFVYAASVLGRYDKAFVNQHKQMVDALIHDYASPAATSQFPKLRNYDSYLGHSFADGYGASLDGNNQESSSEAVNAYYAVYLWGQTTHSTALQQFGAWLYRNEANDALTYWTNIDQSAPQFAQYKQPIVSLVWQGKLDYGTFFSDSPAAKLGIQTIPMSPGQAYLGTDTSRVTENLTSVGQSPDQLADYLLMYQALADPGKASEGLKAITPANIDSGDSKTYLMAWIYSHS